MLSPSQLVVLRLACIVAMFSVTNCSLDKAESDEDLKQGAVVVEEVNEDIVKQTPIIEPEKEEAIDCAELRAKYAECIGTCPTGGINLVTWKRSCDLQYKESLRECE